LQWGVLKITWQKSVELKHMKTPRIFTLAILATAMSFIHAQAASENLTGSNAEKVAPGIWRVRIGTPEKFTPTYFRSAPISENGLKTVANTAPLPFQPDKIGFQTNARGCVLELPLTSSEQVFGFGLNTKLFNMGDRRVWIRPSDNPESEANDSHAPVPFYVTTAGYGVFVDSARYVSFYVGNTALVKDQVQSTENNPQVATSTTDLYKQRLLSDKIMVIDVPAAKGVDIYFFEGPTMMEAVQRYNLFSGGGCLPPLWGLGVWYRGKGDFNAKDCLNLGNQFRETHIPCDVWGLEPGWQTQAYPCSFLWNEGRFPNPEQFIEKMRGMNFHINTWEHIFVHSKSPIYDAIKPLSGNFLVWNGLVPDFGVQKARQIFAELQDRSLFSKGVDSVKLDECDNQPASPTPWSFPECSTFPSGMDGEQMHNLMGLLYQQVINEIPTSKNLRTYNSVRASFALAAPLPFVIYSDSYNHRNYVRAIAKSGFSGLLWTPELRDANSIEDLFRRTETLVFSSQTLVNCWYMKNPPWMQINKDKSNRDELMDNHAEVTAGIRKLFELRTSLIPYLYSAFAQYHYNGIPPFRAVVMDYPQDTNTWKLDDEYLVGPSLLVAPLFEGEKKRIVYLPTGDWYDFWTGEKFAGGRKLEISKPVDQIPVFVKGNTLLPMATPVEYVKPDTCFQICVRVYGSNPQPFVLFEDDGTTWNFEKGAQNQIQLSWTTEKGGQTTQQGGYSGQGRFKVEEWKKQ